MNHGKEFKLFVHDLAVVEVHRRHILSDAVYLRPRESSLEHAYYPGHLLEELASLVLEGTFSVAIEA